MLAFAAPIAVENVPGLHDWHTSTPPVEYVPAIHVLQLSMEAAPMTVEYVPASHLVQLRGEVGPSAVEYVPVGQLAHRSVRFQRSRNSVPYMMNLFNVK